MKNALIFFLLFLIQSAYGNPDMRYGLHFNAYEVEKDIRTGLDLTAQGSLSFPDGFEMAFDVLFEKAEYTFGYVFRITGENNQYIDLLLTTVSPGAAMEPQLTMVHKSGEIIHNCTFKKAAIEFHQWSHCSIRLDKGKNEIRFVLNDQSFSKKTSLLSDFEKVDIVFGKMTATMFQNTDVPSMSLRNIEIKNVNGKTLYNWKLAQYTKGGTYDEIRRRFASCDNPNWILDSNAFWNKRVMFTAGISPQICFSPDEHCIAVFDDSVFYSYDLTNFLLTKNKLPKSRPYENCGNQVLYNKTSGEYLFYDYGKKMSIYNPHENEWIRYENSNRTKDFPAYWHHNLFLSSTNHCFYTFNGYGFHRYKNDINQYDFLSDSWKMISPQGDTIAPRYLSGLGAIDDNTIIIFGGYGSETGIQGVSSQNYYDLYKIDIPSMKTKKIWKMEESGLGYAVANSLVVDTSSQCFYALCYVNQKFNTCLQLYRFSLNKPEYELLGDSIPYPFTDIHSFADLYMDKDSRSLIAVTSYIDKESSISTLSVYTLGYPPLNKNDLFQKKPESEHLISIGICGIVLLFCLFSGFILYKRKKKKKVNQIPNSASELGYNPAGGIKQINAFSGKQSLLLFGGFRVIDKEGKDMTGEFTPLLKQLFLSILLHTLKDGKGISSSKLRETFWFDKTEESARNNRSVSLSKLRQICEPIGLVNIKNQNSYWTVEFEEDIYCDYYEALVLINRLKEKNNRRKEDIKRLLSIVSIGELLPDIQVEWADSFKAVFSNDLIDLFLNFIQQADLDISLQERINLADSILSIHDSLNEEALRLKCSILVKMGKNGLAQKAYRSFVKEYGLLFKTEFKHTFDQIIS